MNTFLMNANSEAATGHREYSRTACESIGLGMTKFRHENNCFFLHSMIIYFNYQRYKYFSGRLNNKFKILLSQKTNLSLNEHDASACS